MDATTQITATFLTQHEVAELLRLPERTLEHWRLTHTGPPYQGGAGSAGVVSQVAAEYETIAAAAQRDRWMSWCHNVGFPTPQAGSAIDSDSFGPLTAELWRAEAHHLMSSACSKAGSDGRSLPRPLRDCRRHRLRRQSPSAGVLSGVDEARLTEQAL
jgi:hypothetical protein